jgi:hypothetical protein
MFRIEALPAGKGDALLLEWGESGKEKDVHRMLIDGGVGSTYAALRERILELPTNASGNRPIDLLVITHIDNDHIEGIILLLCDPDVRLLPADVWFNGWQQLRREGAGDLGYKEGEWLGALLDRFKLPWNKAFGRADPKRIQIPKTGKLPRKKLAGLELVLVSPTSPHLDVLRDKWESAITDAGGVPGDIDAAIEQLRENAALVDEMLGYVDPSVTNATSIAFTATYAGRTALLTGDGHRDTITDALLRLAEEDGLGGPVPVDLFKVCHHGSIGNIDGGLLAAMSCQRFLISTNGASHGHPNAQAIDLIIDTVHKPEIIFNYKVPSTTPWSKEADQKARQYSAIYPTAGKMVVDV